VKTRGHVDQQIQILQAATLSAATREKFLKSLNFRGRDQRFNDVKEAHYKTFQWLFDDMDQEDSRSSLQDDESEESDDSSSYHSGDSDGSQELDFVYEDLVEECRGKLPRLVKIKGGSLLDQSESWCWKEHADKVSIQRPKNSTATGFRHVQKDSRSDTLFLSHGLSDAMQHQGATMHSALPTSSAR
jgi:hypothetical protein